MSGRLRTPLPWVGAHEPLPDPRLAWHEPNGLLAAGADLSPERLLEAYARGIFPWYSDGQPVLWWSPDPRMVLYLDEFRLHRSLAKTIRKNCAAEAPRWRVTLDQAFGEVMRACAAPRDEDGGTWITAQILSAYQGLHRMGRAHSVEVWEGARLVGGLYGVAIGRMFYGESMFARVTDASKVAIAALVCTLEKQDFRVIDCQQNTRHLASLGAREIPREAFLNELAGLIRQPGPDWRAMRIELPHA
ncbi:leucyl/phenylalanyl-tRNA--protein transferase [Zeimonas arvi]|uniref:Leucyl/phenylalanyl-tRNA--protein transferase n=1 Tax=Zeimonas arvi TaxID=2498847 RepID=A0A5C8NRP0_9BURK|nr:leucyl/phenylalanyl-tRNA--protein transferase [Zeimonas arvi]TXL63551.1 leucyl/phenylalanyl-tRNA--protein transferase [Zeimonas arvi]